MLKKNQKYFNWINRLTDMGLIHLSYLAAVIFWLFLLNKDEGNIATYFAFENPYPMMLMSFGCVVLFQYGGIYDSFRTRTVISELKDLLKLYILCIAIMVGCIFLFRIRDFSRGVIVVFGICGFISLLAKRLVLRLTLRYMRKTGYNRKYVLVVGSGSLAEKYVLSLQNNPQYGFSVIGYIGDNENPGLGTWLGHYENLAHVMDIHNPDEVIIALEADELSMMHHIIMDCEEQGVRACIVPMYNDFLPDCASVDVLGSVKLINIRAVALDVSLNMAIKRAMDLSIAVLALTLLSPLMLLTAIGVKLSAPGPVLFKQVRVGKDRREFVMYKFRSMVVNSSSDTAWSSSRDSRVTPFGAFIRKLSIDELPQLFNVIRGDMSIIGPRPELPYFVQKYKYSVPRYMVKHQVKPGLTGWAQINGYRGDTSIIKRIEHDIWYIENWSVFLDIKIIFLTIFGGMVNAEKNLEKEKEVETV